jgi:uncharacterized Zn finger protein
MAQEFYISCPKCEQAYNAHKMIYDKGPDFLMYCPNCMNRYPRKNGKIESANFQLTD